MNRRQFLGISSASLLSPISSPQAGSPTGGVGLTGREWISLYGEPDRVDKFLNPLSGQVQFQSVYSKSDFHFVVYNPLSDPDLMIKLIMVQPNRDLDLQRISVIAESFIPRDASTIGPGLRIAQHGDSFIDYSSEWLKKRVLYEQGPGSDGTLRVYYKQGRAVTGMYEWAQIGVGTYWFI